MTVILGLAAVAGLVLIAARYGADSRTGGDPTGRDAAWPAGPVRHHGPVRDLRALRSLGRLWAGQVRAQQAFERALRPWEGPLAGPVTPRW
jgi:hypothetical protein